MTADSLTIHLGRLESQNIGKEWIPRRSTFKAFLADILIIISLWLVKSAKETLKYENVISTG